MLMIRRCFAIGQVGIEFHRRLLLLLLLLLILGLIYERMLIVMGALNWHNGHRCSMITLATISEWDKMQTVRWLMILELAI